LAGRFSADLARWIMPGMSSRATLSNNLVDENKSLRFTRR
jgi:hypothetical protein